MTDTQQTPMHHAAPAKAVATFIRLTLLREPPVHLDLGEDALDRISEKTERSAQKLAYKDCASIAARLDEAA